MSIIKKCEIDEFIDSDGSFIEGDRNVTNDSEIETGPVQKPFNDDSDYEKGMSTTTDRASRYRQNIPWFAVYSYRGTNTRGLAENNKPNSLTKKSIEDKIKEDLVKKSSNDREIWDKNYDTKTEKVIEIIDSFSDVQLEKLKKVILDKIQKNG
jgi:hypothetical protein